MKSRELVYRVFEHKETPRVPVHIESDDKAEEFRFGDIVGIGAKIMSWREFYVHGGPFRKSEDESLLKWIERIDIDAYEWPEIDSVVDEAVNYYKEKAEKYKDLRFMMFKVLGPTETAESFFAPPARSKNQIFHTFSFAVLIKFRPKIAYALYDRISEYILELVKAGSEMDSVDAIRIADDVADYRGSLYPRTFVKEKYLYWHKQFTLAICKRGKIPILHSDGNLVKAGIFEDLITIYRGLHPLDFRPKSTVHDALSWIDEIIKARKICRANVVFFTGIPIDLVFSDNISKEDIGKIVTVLLRKHGKKDIVLATTHSPYPGRSYKEHLVRSKIDIIRTIVSTSGL